MEGGSGAMEATEPMERDTLEAAVPSLSNEDMEAVSEVSMMPANARIITNSLMLRVNKQTDGAWSHHQLRPATTGSATGLQQRCL